MRSTTILTLTLVIAAGAAGGYSLARHNAASAATTAAPLGAVGQQAMAAYNAKDYATALPLFKKWAETAEVRNDPQHFKTVLAYIVDVQQKLQPASASATQPASADPTSLAALQAQAAAVAAGQANVDPSTGKNRIPHQPILAGQLAVMTIKELGNFEFDPTADTDIPADVKALNGAKVRLRGFMIPLTQAENITDFALVPSLVGCCFGQPPGVQHTITCRTAKGEAVQYSVDECSVEGTVSINVKRDQGYTYSIFELDVTSVKPLDPNQQ
jgi:hypothetical protein